MYICEVATHLTDIGLQYLKNNHPDNVNRLVKKFEKSIEYGNTNFKDFEQIHMLWTPFARHTGKNAKNDPFKDPQEIKEQIKLSFNIHITVIANREYLEAI